SVDVKSAVLVAAPQTAHLAHSLCAEFTLQLATNAALRTRQHTGRTVAHICLLAGIPRLGEIVKRGRPVYVGRAHQKVVGYRLDLLPAQCATLLRSVPNPLKPIVHQ